MQGAAEGCCSVATRSDQIQSAGNKKVLKHNQSDTIPNVTRYSKKNTNIKPKPNTNTRSDKRTHPHAANQHQHIKTQSNKSNQNNTQMQHKNNVFKQTSAPLIVVCLCHDDGATRRQWQP
jgi:hypothetical protein